MASIVWAHGSWRRTRTALTGVPLVAGSTIDQNVIDGSVRDSELPGRRAGPGSPLGALVEEGRQVWGRGFSGFAVMIGSDHASSMVVRQRHRVPGQIWANKN